MSTQRRANKRKLFIGVAVAVILMVALGLLTQLSATSYASFQESLRAHGATVQENGAGSQPFLRGTDRRLSINGTAVDVFEYGTTLETSLDAGRISTDGSTISSGIGPFGGPAATIDFIAPPHWFRSGRVLVLYVGRDGSVLALLQTTLGAPFAGR